MTPTTRALVALMAAALVLAPAGSSTVRADDTITREQADTLIKEIRELRRAIDSLRAPRQAERPPDEKVRVDVSGVPVLGRADAPVTLVEFTDLECPFCRSFHVGTFERLKREYIDTGKVRFIMREFPLDNLAAAASMLARCAGEGKALPLISALFAKQDDWAFVKGDPRPELLKFAKQAGFTQESFEKCLTDQKLLDDISSIRSRAADTFGVNATPTFFVNGKKLNGVGLEDFEKAFESKS
jgi:protein-disulfide isomerase